MAILVVKVTSDESDDNSNEGDDGSDESDDDISLEKSV